MLKEFVEKIESLAVPSIVEQDGLTYSTKPMVRFSPPVPDCLSLLTLTGLVDVIKARIDDLDPSKWLLHVDSYKSVVLVQRCSNAYGLRTDLAKSEYRDGEVFPFGRFLDREEFVIGLQSKFVPGGDLPEVLRLASSLEASIVALSEDDGISQRTTVKQGAVLKVQTTVKGRVTLIPYRTFREVPQPASEFVFRLRSEAGNVPQCALFEADGGKWKLDAVLAIRDWLDAQSLGVQVIA